jgi:xylulokinase
VADRQPVLLAIDLGSTDLKVGLVALDGSLIALRRSPVPIDAPDAWWAATASLVQAALAEASVAAGDVLAVCADGHGPTLVPAAADGAAIGPAIAWSDPRTSADSRSLAEATGLDPWALSILPAAAWLERHERAVAATARWYLNSWEWLAFRLSAVAARTRSAGQVLADPNLPALAAAVDPGRTPRTVDAGTVIGEVLPEVAATLGLAAGTPVVAGVNDAFAACLGIGLLEPGDAYDAGGSAGGFAVYTDRPVRVEGAFSGAAPVPDRWYVGAVMNATGRALEWLSEVTGAAPRELLVDAARVAPGADGLVFLPYLAGERSPLWDPNARAALVGLRVEHGRAQLARAVLEAAALAIRHVAAPIVAAGVAVGEMRVAGRPAESPTWNRIKADVTGFPVAVPAVPEAAVVGAAVLAAVGVGRHSDVRSAIASMTRVVERIEPDPSTRSTYDALFGVYCSLSAQLVETSHALGDLS